MYLVLDETNDHVSVFIWLTLTQRQTLQTSVSKLHGWHLPSSRICQTRWSHHSGSAPLRPARVVETDGRMSAGYRLYSDRDLVRLEQIVALKFIGFPLSQIRDLQNRKNLDVAAALRQQRQIIAEKREHLDRAIRAIERGAGAGFGRAS